MSNTQSKFVRGLKKYGYWVLLALAVSFLVLIITLTAVSNSSKQPSTKIEENINPVSGDVIEFAMPIKETEILKNYSNSALQYSKTLKQWEAHKAIDFVAEEGTDVFAVLDGKVVEVSYNYLMGNIVKLDVGNGLVVVYKSLDNNVEVKNGDTVKKGQVIGHVGNTAKSESEDGAHLHLETWLNNTNVDPNDYLDLEEK